MELDKKIIYSKNKNIVDTFIKVVKDKADFIIIKNDSEENIIIPSNIREYINAVTFIFRESTLDSYKEFLIGEINSNLSKKNIKFFQELNNTSNKILNKKIVNWFNVIFSKELSFASPHLQTITKSTNYSHVSYGDVLSVIRFVHKTRVFSEKETLYFLTYLSNYYSIRLSESLKINSTLDKFDDLINGQLTNVSIKYLPFENNSKPRDYFKIYKSPQEIYELVSNLPIDCDKEELYYWLTFFFDRLGDDKDYSTLDDEIKKRTINRSGGTFHSVTLNAISFIYNSLSPDHVIETYIPTVLTDNVKSSKLYLDIKEWNENLLLNNDYFQIFNIAFFNKFINAMYKRAVTKDSLVYFDAYLYEYIINGVPALIEDLNKDYNFNFEKLLKNPLLVFWKDEKNTNNVNLVLREIFKVPAKQIETKKHLINKEALRVVKDYKSNINNSKNVKTVTTNLIKRLEKNPNVPQNYIESIRDLRIKMNDKSIDINETKSELLRLIDNSTVKNG